MLFLDNETTLFIGLFQILQYWWNNTFKTFIHLRNSKNLYFAYSEKWSNIWNEMIFKQNLCFSNK